jgi:predicted nucleotidyltransferase
MIENLNKEIIKNNDKFIELIKSVDPISVILYGSYSTNKQTINSDIDLLIIFKQKILNKYLDIDNKIINLKEEIIKLFNKNLDIVVMIKTNKIQYNIYEYNYDIDYNNNFISNIYSDLYILYGDKHKDIILESFKYKKF